MRHQYLSAISVSQNFTDDIIFSICDTNYCSGQFRSRLVSSKFYAFDSGDKKQSMKWSLLLDLEDSISNLLLQWAWFMITPAHLPIISYFLNDALNESDLCSLCAMHWCKYPQCVAGTNNLWMTGVLMIQFIVSPKHDTRGATNNHFDSCFSLCAFLPVSLYPHHNTAVCIFLSTI